MQRKYPLTRKQAWTEIRDAFKNHLMVFYKGGVPVQDPFPIRLGEDKKTFVTPFKKIVTPHRVFC